MSGIEASEFGTAPDGARVQAFTLTSAGGARVRILDFGGIVVSLELPDRDGRLGDVVLGHATLEGYLADTTYLGALIGRVANRIGSARFTLDGNDYPLLANNGPHHLHGGPDGFHRRRWRAEASTLEGGVALRLERESPDGEEGYPGTLRAEVTYTLGDDASLGIDYAAVTDAPTPVNLTHHSYFDLSAGTAPDVLGHRLTLHADAFLPTDTTQIPTGDVRAVEGTPFDFREPSAIGARLDAPDEQLRAAGGYDHHYVIRGWDGGLREAARVVEPRSGRVLQLLTTERGLQFYSGNQLSGARGKGGRRHAPRTGFCLEAQGYPNALNQPAFPPVVLRPGERYRQRTVYRFSAA